MRSFIVSLFLGCLAIPADLNAQTAAEYIKRGNEWAEKGEYDKAIADFNRAFAINRYADAYYNRGLAWEKKGEHDKAIADFNRALAINRYADAYYNNRGLAWEKKGEHDKAIADYTQALTVNPNYIYALLNRGHAWEKKGEHDKAIADVNQGLAIAYYNRGNSCMSKGEYGKAIAYFNRALATNPNYADAYNSLGWLYATCPDAKYRDEKKAVEKASKACQLTGEKDWGKLDTLAAAYAECGDFDKAREWEEKAIDLATSEKDKAELRSHLGAYKQGKAWREK